MGFFSDLYESGKKTLYNVYDTVKTTAKNWSEGRFLAPNMSFCGPGNPTSREYIEKHYPTASASDRSCLQHDLDYEGFRKQKDQGKISDAELKTLVRESDDRLIANLRQDPQRSLGSYLSEMGIRGKKFAEDLGILSPEKFVT